MEKSELQQITDKVIEVLNQEDVAARAILTEKRSYDGIGNPTSDETVFHPSNTIRIRRNSYKWYFDEFKIKNDCDEIIDLTDLLSDPQASTYVDKISKVYWELLRKIRHRELNKEASGVFAKLFKKC